MELHSYVIVRSSFSKCLSAQTTTLDYQSTHDNTLMLVGVNYKCSLLARKETWYSNGYEYGVSTHRGTQEEMEGRTDPAADGKSASSMYDQQETWLSSPEIEVNELAKPRVRSDLSRLVEQVHFSMGFTDHKCVNKSVSQDTA